MPISRVAVGWKGGRCTAAKNRRGERQTLTCVTGCVHPCSAIGHLGVDDGEGLLLHRNVQVKPHAACVSGSLKRLHRPASRPSSSSGSLPHLQKLVCNQVDQTLEIRQGAGGRRIR